MLSDRDNDRLMIRRSVDGAETEITDGDTGGNSSRDLTANGSTVDTLEEEKLLGVSWSGLSKTGELLNDDVSVADDLAALQLLRSSEVALLCVDEVTSNEVIDCHCNGECAVCLDGTEVLGESELG